MQLAWGFFSWQRSFPVWVLSPKVAQRRICRVLAAPRRVDGLGEGAGQDDEEGRDGAGEDEAGRPTHQRHRGQAGDQASEGEATSDVIAVDESRRR